MIYLGNLGMRVNTIAGVNTLVGFGPKISAAVDAKPDGLLLHENFLLSLRHLGMRQYWRDLPARAAMFTARQRAGTRGTAPMLGGGTESELDS